MQIAFRVIWRLNIVYIYGNLSIYVLHKEADITEEVEDIIIVLRCSLTSSGLINSIEIQFI